MLEINQWTKPPRSNGSGGNNCVEVKYDPFNVLVRNSTDRLGATAMFTPEEWKIFIADVKDGHFDIP